MVAANRCHNDNTVLVRGTYAYRKEVSGSVFTATIPARVCPVCGEKLIEARDLLAKDREAARTIAAQGPVDGHSFRFMRSALAMRAADLAVLLDVTPETISKWENRRTPVPRVAWLVLAQMVLDEDQKGKRSPVKDRMEALAKGKRARKRVKLDAA